MFNPINDVAMRVLRLVMVGLAMAIFAMASFVFGVSWCQAQDPSEPPPNRLQLEGQPQGASPKIRNILLLVSDDLKASALGCYGDPHCQTPNIDRLAGRGMLFRRAYCQGTWCQPSRLSFMHSRYTDGGGAMLNLGQHLQRHGLHAARVGKIYHMRVPGDIIAGTDGNDIESTWNERYNSAGREAHTPGDYACLNLNIFTTELEGRQSTRMPHRMFVTVRYEGDGADQPDYKTADKTVELLRKHQDRPFFIAAGFVRPHYPMVAPQQYFDPYPWDRMTLPSNPDGDLDDIPRPGWAGTRSGANPIGKYPDNQKRMWAGYYAAISFMDAQVGRVLDEVDRLDLRDSTAVIFTSDHGYHLGEHTFWQKSNLHEEVTRVPMIISAPGMRPGATDSLAELVDLFPTAADLVGAPAADSAQGKSLAPILRDPQATVAGGREGALSINRGGFAWRTARWAYMLYADDSQELYDMREDPGQFTNVVKQQPDVAAELKGQLLRHLQEHGIGRKNANGKSNKAKAGKGKVGKGKPAKAKPGKAGKGEARQQ